MGRLLGLRNSVAYSQDCGYSNSTDMIKNFLASKIVSAASGECFIIGIKLADTEAHAIRLFGFLLFLASAIVMFVEWHHKAHAETVRTVPALAVPVTKSSKRSRKNRARR